MSKIVAVAPMMDRTDRHFRYFIRLMSKQSLLYTEMVTTGALLLGDSDRFLRYSEVEHPISLQLGGCDPTATADCAKLAKACGYDEVNLNVGCPSDRVRSGKMGACLMAEPDLVAQCVEAMQTACQLPITVKTRIGIGRSDSLDLLYDFIRTVSRAGCQHFTIHARKAWLDGLSPKENRHKPPLRYDVVKQLKHDFPNLHISLNGGISTLEDMEKHLKSFDGVMIGRAAYQNPYLFAHVDQTFFNCVEPVISRREIVEAYIPYCLKEAKAGVRLSVLLKPLFGLLTGECGAKRWKSFLNEILVSKGAGLHNLMNHPDIQGDFL